MSRLGTLLKSNIQRQPVDTSAEGLVKTSFQQPDFPISFTIEPAVDGFDLVAWSAANRELIAKLLLAHRAILFRNCGITTASRFHAFITATSSGELLEYRDRSTPRRAIEGGIYTSTEYPAEHPIALHNEGTYWVRRPLKIYFCCVLASTSGGETPIADVRRVLQRIAPTAVERFRQKQVLYVRNYNDGFGLPWQAVFQTDDKDCVETYCRQNWIEFEWKSGGRLRTRQLRPAVVNHPVTGEPVWFNHAAFFHVSSLNREVRETLLRDFGEQELPYNTYYGDGSEIEPDVLDEIRAAYRDETVAFSWREGDVMLVDNMSVAHGRNPYSGPRQILAGMSEPFDIKF